MTPHEKRLIDLVARGLDPRVGHYLYEARWAVFGGISDSFYTVLADNESDAWLKAEGMRGGPIAQLVKDHWGKTVYWKHNGAIVSEVCLKCGIGIDDSTAYHDKCNDCARKLGLPNVN